MIELLIAAYLSIQAADHLVAILCTAGAGCILAAFVLWFAIGSELRDKR